MTRELRFGPKSATLSRFGPLLGRFRLKLAETGPMLDDVGKVGPNRAECDHSWVNVGQFWPNSAKSWTISAIFAELGRKGNFSKLVFPSREPNSRAKCQPVDRLRRPCDCADLPSVWPPWPALHALFARQYGRVSPIAKSTWHRGNVREGPGPKHRPRAALRQCNAPPNIHHPRAPPSQHEDLDVHPLPQACVQAWRATHECASMDVTSGASPHHAGIPDCVLSRPMPH